MKKSPLELAMSEILRQAKYEFVEEYKFHPDRKWRFDFYLPKYNVGIEVEGGIYSAGRHSRAKGFMDDCEKYNQAQLLGYKVLRYTGEQLNDVLKDLKMKDKKICQKS